MCEFLELSDQEKMAAVPPATTSTPVEVAEFKSVVLFEHGFFFLSKQIEFNL